MNPGFRRITFGLLLLIPIAGCQVATFSNPLVDPSEATVPKELLGSYLLIQDDPSIDSFDDPLSVDEDDVPYNEFQHIGIAGDDFPPGFVRIVRVDIPQNSVNKIEYSSLVGFTARIGDHFVLHVPVPKKLPIDETTYQGKWNPANFEGYLFAVLKPTESGIDLRIINADFIVSEIQAGRLAGNYTPSQPVRRDREPGETEAAAPPELIVTAGQDALAAFFKQHMDGEILWESSTKYRRIK